MNRHVPLLFASVLLALFFGWKCLDAWNAPPPDLPTPRGGVRDAASGPAPAGAPPAADPFPTVASIVARPLFRPDRLPFREAAVIPPQRDYPGELARFRVLGTLFLPEGARAIVTAPAAAGGIERYEVGVGDGLPGFTVREVRTDAVLVEADGREFTLFLYAGGPRGGSPAEKGEAASAPPPRGAAPPAPRAGGAGGFLPPPAAGPAAPFPPRAVTPALVPGAPTPGTGAPTPGPPIRFRTQYPRPNFIRPSMGTYDNSNRGTR